MGCGKSECHGSKPCWCGRDGCDQDSGNVDDDKNKGDLCECKSGYKHVCFKKINHDFGSDQWKRLCVRADSTTLRKCSLGLKTNTSKCVDGWDCGYNTDKRCECPKEYDMKSAESIKRGSDFLNAYCGTTELIAMGYRFRKDLQNAEAGKYVIENYKPNRVKSLFKKLREPFVQPDRPEIQYNEYTGPTPDTATMPDNSLFKDSPRTTREYILLNGEITTAVIYENILHYFGDYSLSISDYDYDESAPILTLNNSQNDTIIKKKYYETKAQSNKDKYDQCIGWMYNHQDEYDPVFNAYCTNSNYKDDPLCNCHPKNTSIQVPYCYDLRCTENPNAWKWEDQRTDLNSGGCPNYMNCEQYITIEDSDKAYLENIDMYQECTQNDNDGGDDGGDDGGSSGGSGGSSSGSGDDGELPDEKSYTTEIAIGLIGFILLFMFILIIAIIMKSRKKSRKKSRRNPDTDMYTYSAYQPEQFDELDSMTY
jgi:uncharacterized membrane protein YgcG